MGFEIKSQTALIPEGLIRVLTRVKLHASESNTIYEMLYSAYHHDVFKEYKRLNMNSVRNL